VWGLFPTLIKLPTTKIKEKTAVDCSEAAENNKGSQ
jgi:hypothetical protein